MLTWFRFVHGSGAEGADVTLNPKRGLPRPLPERASLKVCVQVEPDTYAAATCVTAGSQPVSINPARSRRVNSFRVPVVSDGVMAASWPSLWTSGAQWPASCESGTGAPNAATEAWPLKVVPETWLRQELAVPKPRTCANSCIETD